MAMIAAMAVGLALAGGSALFVLLLQWNLRGAVDAALVQQAQNLAEAAHQEGAAGLDLRHRVGDSNVIQLLSASGTVLTASSELDGQAGLSSARPSPGSYVMFTTHLSGADEPYRLIALGLTDPNGQALVLLVGQSNEPVATSTSTVTRLLLVGAPALVLLVAALTYWLSGRALRPVEAMRRQVADIDARSLGLRVPLPAAHDEVRALAHTMNRMLERLESAAGAQRRFVSDASHELKSPLAALRASVEVSQAYPDRSDWPATGEVVLQEALRLERLVADLLLLTRADERGLQLRRDEVDLDDIVTAEAARLRSTTALEVLIQLKPVRVIGDRDGLQRAVRNLVDNASQHARSSVSLTLTVIEQHARIDITDDGPGVPLAERQRVFERFVRLDESRARAAGGTGLGLSIVAQIAAAHDGDIAVMDSPTGGFLVRLSLPLVRR